MGKYFYISSNKFSMLRVKALKYQSCKSHMAPKRQDICIHIDYHRIKNVLFKLVFVVYDFKLQDNLTLWGFC